MNGVMSASDSAGSNHRAAVETLSTRVIWPSGPAPAGAAANMVRRTRSDMKSLMISPSAFSSLRHPHLALHRRRDAQVLIGLPLLQAIIPGEGLSTQATSAGASFGLPPPCQSTT